MPPGCGQLLQPRRDIDVVAEDIVLLDDDVADVDADAKQEALLGRRAHCLLKKRFLELQSAAKCLDRAGKLGKEAVACRLDDPPGWRWTAGRIKFAIAALKLACVVSSFLCIRRE